MKLELKDFQKEAVANLLGDLASAKNEIERGGRGQALLLSAPTASGKTVIMAALIERILGGDGGLSDELPFEPDPDAVVLWLSDQPELNRQSRQRLLSASDRLRPHDLVLIGADFDAEYFDGGKVYFLNSQKIARDRLLTRLGDGRHWTIWETIGNTQCNAPSRFYVILDEAHRGMNVPTQERDAANSIVQKFLIGSPEDGLPAMNLVLGLSATPERFQTFLQGTGRIVRPYDIDPADVRASGLIKERIVLHPQADQPSPWTLMAEACTRFKEMEHAWSAYTKSNGTDPIQPALVIQIEDGSRDSVSRTALGPLFETLRENLPDLRPEEVVHCLQHETPLTVGAWRISYADPSSIAANALVKVILFKTALTTGWDCPRAEVMISFRAAQDMTSIAQLVGRMVRTPLARRVHGNEQLNEVYLFLPRYNEEAVNAIVDRLTADKDSVPGTEITTSKSAAVLSVREDLQWLLPHLRQLPTYTFTARRKTSNLRRLLRLGRLLMQDGIAEEAHEVFVTQIADVLATHLERRMEEDAHFVERLQNLETITYQSVILHAGELRVERGPSRTTAVTARDVESLFSRARAALTDEVAMAFWRRRFDPAEPLRGKLETYELALDETLHRKIEELASELLQQQLSRCRSAISRLNPERRARYNELHAVARQEEAGLLEIPDTITLDLPSDAQAFADHLFVDANGVFRHKLNGWEATVLEVERQRSDFITWIRNLDRKPWALTFPYTFRGKRQPGYPDFLVVRRDGDAVTIDILEPHRGEDSVAKAKGLAVFADRHGADFGRIELIRIDGGRLQRLDLNDRRVRRVVLPVETHDELMRIFDRFC